MLVKSYAAAVQGISATVVTVEVNCSKGIQFFLVGLPDVAVRESHERIISALQVCGYKFPRNRIVINMAPADIRKEGYSGGGRADRFIQLIQIRIDGRAFYGREPPTDKRGIAYRYQG